MYGKSVARRLDWLTILLFLLLSFFGWLNLYSTTLTDESASIFDFGTLYGKQLFFILFSICIGAALLYIETSFFERFASVFTYLLLYF